MVSVALVGMKIVEAEIFAETWEATPVVAMENVPDVCPAGIVMLGGTVAAGLLVESLTSRPAVGAAALRVTVAVDGVPPVTMLELRLTLETLGSPRTVLTNPENTMGPHPVVKSQPTVGFEVAPLGSVPLLGPLVMSVNTAALTLVAFIE